MHQNMQNAIEFSFKTYNDLHNLLWYWSYKEICWDIAAVILFDDF